MKLDGKEMQLDVSGLGIVFHSPEATKHIPEGADYLSDNYWAEEQVQAHLQQGSIVGFGTGTPGTFLLRFRSGTPDPDFVSPSGSRLSLGLQCQGGRVCFRDLYELMDWRQACPADRTLKLDDGFYLVTVCSELPPSGVLGDNQEIDLFLLKVDELPSPAEGGIPTLFAELPEE